MILEPQRRKGRARWILFGGPTLDLQTNIKSGLEYTQTQGLTYLAMERSKSGNKGSYSHLVMAGPASCSRPPEAWLLLSIVWVTAHCTGTTMVVLNMVLTGTESLRTTPGDILRLSLISCPILGRPASLTLLRSRSGPAAGH